MAAERQMRKIATASTGSRATSPFVPVQVQLHNDTERSLSALAATSFSSASNNSNTSNRTLLTSHRTSGMIGHAKTVVVAESPPVLLTPKYEKENKTTPPTTTNGSDAVRVCALFVYQTIVCLTCSRDLDVLERP
jgi:hypothetical protein